MKGVRECFIEGCNNIATSWKPCGQCPDGHWACMSCEEKIGLRTKK